MMDVIIILVFMIGFKFSTAYLMVVMTRWFEDEPDSAEKPNKSKEKPVRLQVPSYRRLAWLGLAGLWILNGVIQFRPLMVMQSAHVLLQHSTRVSPSWLLPLLQKTDMFFAQTPIWVNISSAVLQLMMGLFMLIWPEKLLGKVALWLSLVVSLGTWVLWEGLGHLFQMGGSYLVGGPGAGILFFIAGLLLLRPVSWWEKGGLARFTRLGFSVFWLLCAIWQAIPGNGLWGQKGLNLGFYQPVKPPVWLESIHQGAATLVLSSPVLWNLVLIGVFLALAVLNWLAFANSLVLGVFMVWFVVSWLVGQSLGLAGGMAVPVNAAPVLALMYLTGWLGIRAERHAVSGAQLSRQPARNDEHQASALIDL